MRKLIASTFVSLDGVMQAPGGPEEDPTGGFAFGGWTFSYWDEVMGRSMNGFDGKDRELVLGRKTYEIFEAYWPDQPADNPVAKLLNADRKHVASRTLTNLQWNNSTLLRGDVASAVAALKSEPGLTVYTHYFDLLFKRSPNPTSVWIAWKFHWSQRSNTFPPSANATMSRIGDNSHRYSAFTIVELLP